MPCRTAVAGSRTSFKDGMENGEIPRARETVSATVTVKLNAGRRAGNTG